MDPYNKYISAVLTREHCIEFFLNYYIKDLRVIKNYDLANIVIVDNMAHSFAAQMQNGIYIPSYHGDKTDMELPKIRKFLISLSTVDDVRPLIKMYSYVRKLYKFWKSVNSL